MMDCVRQEFIIILKFKFIKITISLFFIVDFCIFDNLEEDYINLNIKLDNMDFVYHIFYNTVYTKKFFKKK